MKSVCALFSILVLSSAAAFAIEDPARWVNPFIGTGGHGHTFPGATMPFGMVQLSPDTRIDNWDGSSGYHYSDDIIYGFSHTHLSGTGIPDYCDILFAPYISDGYFWEASPENTKMGFASKFSHDNEKAEPGYYSVRLDDEDILAEMTATERVGFHRYTFPKGTKEAKIALDLKWRDEVLGSRVKIVGDRRVEGFRRSRSWAKDQVVFFSAEFSYPFSWTKSVGSRDGNVTNEAAGSVTNFRFAVSNEKPLLLRVGISAVSIQGARKNLEAEVPHWDFDKVRKDARAAWNKELSKIEVSGGTDAEKTNFYTALYHTMIAPNVYNDVDGNYRGLDHKIHNIRSDSVSSPTVRKGVSEAQASARATASEGSSKSPTVRKGVSEAQASARATASEGSSKSPTVRKGVSEAQASARATASEGSSKSPTVREGVSGPSKNYTVFSLWDTFRATHPLYTIIDEKRTVEFINTFIRMYEQGGKLPVWELAGNETDTMIGYHAVSVIADAMAKGIEGFDYERAYKAAKHSSELEIEGRGAYRRRGYISMEDEQESVSRTLEYAYNDFCIAAMARMLGKSDDHRLHLRRAQFYKNLFDKQTGFMRPKQNGSWISPFSPNEVTFHFTEANSWQYTFHVTQDVPGLIRLFGGKEQFAAKLDELFTTESKLEGRDQPDITGLIGQYAHGNEPSHHIAYLYNFAGQAWKTQYYVRKIMDEFYKPQPDGLIGNEDCGQMSAWYVLSALGFYQVNPGDPVYAIGSPVFKEAKIHLENGKTFTIARTGEGPYVSSVRLNGEPHRKPFFSHKDIVNGGSLEFTMSKEPVRDWFTDATEASPGDSFPPVPTIAGDRVFEDSTEVTISSPEEGFNIVYAVSSSPDGPGEPTKPYGGPFTVSESSIVTAVSVSVNGIQSLIAESSLNKMPHDWDVTLVSKYGRQYTGGGPKGLIDGLRGTTNFASGEWQGYQGQDFEAVIDLKRKTRISKVGGGFLQVARSWIWMPRSVSFEVSDDGKTWRKVAEIETNFPEREMEHTIRDYVKTIDPVSARYVRVKAINFGKLPAWHPGAGYDAYIFVDEIMID